MDNICGKNFQSITNFTPFSYLSHSRSWKAVNRSKSWDSPMWTCRSSPGRVWPRDGIYWKATTRNIARTTPCSKWRSICPCRAATPSSKCKFLSEKQYWNLKTLVHNSNGDNQCFFWESPNFLRCIWKISDGKRLEFCEKKLFKR